MIRLKSLGLLIGERQKKLAEARRLQSGAMIRKASIAGDALLIVNYSQSG